QEQVRSLEEAMRRLDEVTAATHQQVQQQAQQHQQQLERERADWQRRMEEQHRQLQQLHEKADDFRVAAERARQDAAANANLVASMRAELTALKQQTSEELRRLHQSQQQATQAQLREQGELRAEATGLR